MAKKFPDLGGFTGKQMKSLLAFCRKGNVLHPLCTPFFYNGKLYASDESTCVVMDANVRQNDVIPQDRCYSLCADNIEKPLVKDYYYFSDGPVCCKLGGEHASLEDKTDRLQNAAKLMLELADKTAVAQDDSLLFDPTLIKRVCELGEAFGFWGMRFESVPHNEQTNVLRVTYTHDESNVRVIVMPKRV